MTKTTIQTNMIGRMVRVAGGTDMSDPEQVDHARGRYFDLVGEVPVSTLIRKANWCAAWLRAERSSR